MMSASRVQNTSGDGGSTARRLQWNWFLNDNDAIVKKIPNMNSFFFPFTSTKNLAPFSGLHSAAEESAGEPAV